MAHTQVWDSSYENIPADNDQASEGALRIRNLKRDTRERAEVDHDWDDITDAGKHTQITFVDPLGADPADVADEGMLYTKDVSAKAELFWKDEDGNVIQLTSAGAFNTFPSGTAMLFYQDAAPTGWTIAAAVDEHAIRLSKGSVAGGQAGGAAGGSVNFSTVFGLTATDGHSLTIAELAAHSHPTVAIYTGNLGVAGGGLVHGTVNTSAGSTGSTGSGNAHAHNIDLQVKHAVCIVATRD